jgi:hypothetical protein
MYVEQGQLNLAYEVVRTVAPNKLGLVDLDLQVNRSMHFELGIARGPTLTAPFRKVNVAVPRIVSGSLATGMANP